MRQILCKTTVILCLNLVFMGCNSPKETEGSEEAGKVIAQVSENYVPDRRVALFDVEAQQIDDDVVLRGESNLPDAVDALKRELEAKNINFRDSIKILPAEDLEGKTRGLIKVSVANLRGKPAHSSELVTQATLGTPVKVYKKEGDWIYIQTPDDYLAWVDAGGVTTFSEEELDAWRGAEKIIFLKPFGQSFEKPTTESEVVSDLVAGNIFVHRGEQDGFFEVQYPTGETAFIEKQDAQDYREWLNSLEQKGDDLIATSRQLKGLPYLWGGTSPKGVDCSGFTKTIYFMNGIIIPRDASQQVHTGQLIDSTRTWSNLEKGDLLFFGRLATDTTSERVVHVGMWIGDNRFIHSSGNVRISSVDSADQDFDEFNFNRYLRTKRLLNQEDRELVHLSQSDLFMDNSLSQN